MFTDVYHSFYYAALITGALAAAVFIKQVSAPFKWLALLLILTFISESTAKFISFSLKKDASLVYHIFTLVEFLLYTAIYRSFFKAKIWDRILALSFFILLSAEILNVVFLQNLKTDNTNTLILESLLLVFISLGLFNNIKERAAYENLLKEGAFWFNSMVLFYYSFSILIWGFHSIKVYQMKNPPIIIYYLNLLLSGLLYLVFSISLFLNFYSKRKTALNV